MKKKHKLCSNFMAGTPMKNKKIKRKTSAAGAFERMASQNKKSNARLKKNRLKNSGSPTQNKKTRFQLKKNNSNSASSSNNLKLKVTHYENTTKKALGIVSVFPNLSAEKKELALDFLDLAKRYFDDACFFREKGDLATALAAFSYAHAWLDAGVRSKILDGKNNDQLFVLPKK